MNHRKEKYYKLTRSCKYFIQGNCNFGEVCWYRHEMNVNETTKPVLEEIICKVCDQIFPYKSELIKHRKKDYSEMISMCRNINDKFCRFINEECWYKHELITNKAYEEVMNKIIDITENYAKKIEVLANVTGCSEILERFGRLENQF